MAISIAQDGVSFDNCDEGYSENDGSQSRLLGASFSSDDLEKEVAFELQLQALKDKLLKFRADLLSRPGGIPEDISQVSNEAEFESLAEDVHSLTRSWSTLPEASRSRHNLSSFPVPEEAFLEGNQISEHEQIKVLGRWLSTPELLPGPAAKTLHSQGMSTPGRWEDNDPLLLKDATASDQALTRWTNKPGWLQDRHLLLPFDVAAAPFANTDCAEAAGNGLPDADASIGELGEKLPCTTCQISPYQANCHWLNPAGYCQKTGLLFPAAVLASGDATASASASTFARPFDGWGCRAGKTCDGALVVGDDAQEAAAAEPPMEAFAAAVFVHGLVEKVQAAAREEQLHEKLRTAEEATASYAEMLKASLARAEACEEALLAANARVLAAEQEIADKVAAYEDMLLIVGARAKAAETESTKWAAYCNQAEEALDRVAAKAARATDEVMELVQTRDCASVEEGDLATSRTPPKETESPPSTKVALTRQSSSPPPSPQTRGRYIASVVSPWKGGAADANDRRTAHCLIGSPPLSLSGSASANASSASEVGSSVLPMRLRGGVGTGTIRRITCTIDSSAASNSFNALHPSSSASSAGGVVVASAGGRVNSVSTSTKVSAVSGRVAALNAVGTTARLSPRNSDGVCGVRIAGSLALAAKGDGSHSLSLTGSYPSAPAVGASVAASEHTKAMSTCGSPTAAGRPSLIVRRSSKEHPPATTTLGTPVVASGQSPEARRVSKSLGRRTPSVPERTALRRTDVTANSYNTPYHATVIASRGGAAVSASPPNSVPTSPIASQSTPRGVVTAVGPRPVGFAESRRRRRSSPRTATSTASLAASTVGPRPLLGLEHRPPPLQMGDTIVASGDSIGSCEGVKSPRRSMQTIVLADHNAESKETTRCEGPPSVFAMQITPRHSLKSAAGSATLSAGNAGVSTGPPSQFAQPSSAASSAPRPTSTACAPPASLQSSHSSSASPGVAAVAAAAAAAAAATSSNLGVGLSQQPGTGNGISAANPRPTSYVQTAALSSPRRRSVTPVGKARVISFNGGRDSSPRLMRLGTTDVGCGQWRSTSGVVSKMTQSGISARR
eukprot:TRINITY_DN37626_c0_g1_i1.p1 TRINITY_DN37626_c0_g1~~TRINITY_DN37626_c0_g1_i1.p1  ORF type:complete len:1077 (+),score=172.96 TRINITY_DN37626_c0_g1_i1:306-3536(+)